MARNRAPSAPPKPLAERYADAIAKARALGDRVDVSEDGNSLTWTMNPDRLEVARAEAARRAKPGAPVMTARAEGGPERALIVAGADGHPAINPQMSSGEAWHWADLLARMSAESKRRTAAREAGKARGRQRKAAASPKYAVLRSKADALWKKNPRLSEQQVAELLGVNRKTLRAAHGKRR
jgi:hypothetical protein